MDNDTTRNDVKHTEYWDGIIRSGKGNLCA